MYGKRLRMKNSATIIKIDNGNRRKLKKYVVRR